MLTYLTIFFILGLIFGSFANVCIYRIPQDISVIKPRSFCPSCLQQIKWYDNIPLLSFFFLKKRCRYCYKKISWQYPLIEIITGLAFLFVAMNNDFGILLFFYLLFAFILIIVAGIDFFHQIIPDVLPLLLIITGLSLSFLNNNLGGIWYIRFFNSFIGGIVGGVSLLVISFIGKKILKKEAMGGGDVKLLIGIGTILGYQKALLTLFFASIIGSIIGIILIMNKKINREDYLPFGPFLSLAAYINLFIPGVEKYLSFFIQK